MVTETHSTTLPAKNRLLNENTWITRLVIPLISIIFAVVLAGLFPMPQAHAATVSTGTINSEDEISYEAGSNTLYFYDTVATNSNVNITTNSNFTLLSTSTTTCGSTLAASLSYEVKTARSIAVGESVSYGSSSNPCVTIYVTKAGYAGDGTLFDVEYKFNTITIDNSLDNSANSNICVLEILENGDLFDTGFWMTSYKAANVHMDVTVTLYETGTSNVLDGYSWIWKIVDIDQPGRKTNSYTAEYAESIMFVSGFDNTVYTLANSYVSFADYTYNGKTYTRVVGSQSDDTNSLLTGFVTEITSGQINFIWSGGSCGTRLALNALEHTTPAPVKEVNKSTAYLGDNITYTVTQTVPYQKYFTLTFTDVLDSAYNVSSATITIYRTYVDTDNGGTIRSNDTSNWTISTTTSTNTITATRSLASSSNTGGDYEFIITVPLSTSADLSSHSTTTSNGTKMYIVPNTASIQFPNMTKSTNTVQTLIPPAEVQYQLVGTNKPSDSILPSGVTTYAGASYTIEDGLTTSDTSVVWYFNGWYYDSSLTEPASGTINLPEGTTILYGQWLVSEVTLEKTADDTLPDNVVAGDTIDYTFKITNSGETTLTNITLYDNKIGGYLTVTNTTLAPGEYTIVRASYTLTQSDIDSGSVYNTATTTGEDPGGSSVTDNDDETTTVPQSPSISLVKAADSYVISDAEAGVTTITYTFTIKNTGNVTLSNITLIDEKLGGSIAVSPTTLAPGGEATASATYTVKQSDIDTGSVYNQATTTGTPPSGSNVTATDYATVKIEWSPQIELVKTADVSVVENAVAGTSTITYMFTVTNTGNVSLSNIALTDPLLGGEIELEKTVLTPNASTLGWATYTVTQDDVDAGIVKNTATVTGDDPGGSSVTDNDGVDVDVEQLPSIDLVKEVVGDVVIEDAYAGDWVQFAVTVTNTGNTTLSNVTITDLLEGATFVVEELDGVTFNNDSVVVDTMLPGDTVTIYVDYQLTQADIDRGDTENIATVTADPPGDLNTIYDDDDATIETPSDPSISLTKTANVESVEFALPGDVIYYTLTITNTGNTTISNLTLYDELLGGDITESLDKTTIAPGESATALLSYTLTQDDIDAGSVYNFATATGEDPNSTTVEGEDDYTVELIANPSITLTKTVTPANDVANEDLTTGDELTYTLIIANNGNQTLTNITLYDELLGGEIDLTNAVKGIDMTVINYEATDEDTIESEAVEDDGDVDGIALADEEAVETVEEAVIADDTASISTRAYYTEHATVSEDDPITTLRPGEYLLVEITYTITQDDMNTGRVDNTASVTAEDPNGNGMSDEDTAVMYLPQHPEITLVKDASFNSLVNASVGDMINYTLTITNTGDVSLTNLALTDELEGIVIDTSVLDGLTLTPGETVVVTAEYSLTDADLEAGSVYNHATVTAESIVPYDEDNIWSGSQQVSDDDDALVDGIVAVADDLILAQTGGKTLIIFGCLFAGLATTAGIATGYIGKQRRTNIK